MERVILGLYQVGRERRFFGFGHTLFALCAFRGFVLISLRILIPNTISTPLSSRVVLSTASGSGALTRYILTTLLQQSNQITGTVYRPRRPAQGMDHHPIAVVAPPYEHVNALLLAQRLYKHRFLAHGPHSPYTAFAFSKTTF